MASYEVTQAFIETIKANGVEYIFYNPGYDVIPLLGSIARYKTQGEEAPPTILCLDESVAMAAAHGSYMVSGKPQVVLVHSELGTMQIGGALHQAQWGRVPAVICAALREPEERQTWKGEPFDQGSIVRNCVKWDHYITENENFADVLDRAFEIATTEPKGPVYLWYKRDRLFKTIEVRPEVLQGKRNMTPNSAVDTAVLNKTADMLLEAESPLIMTGYSGRNQETVGSLVKLAEAIGARVITAPFAMNFPSNHPLCANIEANDGPQVRNPYINSTDVLLVIDYDLSYASPRDQPGPNTKILHIDVDFLKQGLPLWKRKPEVTIKADSSQVIPALNKILQKKMNPEKQTVISQRTEKLKLEHQKLRDDWKAMALNAASKKPISPEWVCYCLSEVIDENTIIVNQTIGPAVSVARQIPMTKPGTSVACSGGSMGWAPAAALGAKITAQDKTVVSLMGDGVFVYGCPTATLWPAVFYKAPFLAIIFNNQEYGAIKMGLKMAYPEGIKAAEIVPSPNYALTAQACGAYGRKIEDPSDVLPALKEAMQEVQNGRPAVLDVRI
jgi:acetolactate synthase I/II/III large subunit